MSSTQKDAALVQACRDGDRGAFESLVRRYEGPVFNIVYRLVQRYDDTRDITQTVFLKAYERLATYDARYKFFSWVYRIAVNESLNFLNKLGRMDSLETEPVSTRRDPGDEAVGADLGRQVRSALMQLKPNYRAVIVLRHFMDCTYQDMAEILHLPEKTVKSRLFTARQQLKQLLSDKGIAR